VNAAKSSPTANTVLLMMFLHELSDKVKRHVLERCLHELDT